MRLQVLAPGHKGDGGLSGVDVLTGSGFPVSLSRPTFPNYAGDNDLIILAADPKFWQLLQPIALKIILTIPASMFVGMVGAAGNQLFNHFFPSKLQISLDKSNKLLHEAINLQKKLFDSTVDKSLDSDIINSVIREIPENKTRMENLIDAKSAELHKNFQTMTEVQESQSWNERDLIKLGYASDNPPNREDFQGVVQIEQGRIDPRVLSLAVILTAEFSRERPDNDLIDVCGSGLEKLKDEIATSRLPLD